jgi:hypothetical protein
MLAKFGKEPLSALEGGGGEGLSHGIHFTV